MDFPLPVWKEIAAWLPPNQYSYFEFSTISRNARVAFTSDDLWKHVTPLNITKRLYPSWLKRVDRLTKKDRRWLIYLWMHSALCEGGHLGLARCDLSLSSAEFYGKDFRSKLDQLQTIRKTLDFSEVVRVLHRSQFDLVLAQLCRFYDEGPWQYFSQAREYAFEDKSFVFAAVTKDPMFLKEIRAFQDDFDIVACAVACDGRAIEYASESLKMNRYILRLVARSHPFIAASYCPEIFIPHVRRLYHNKQLVEEHICDCEDGLSFFPEYQMDKSVVMSAVSYFGTNLQFAHPLLQGNREIVLRAVSSAVPPRYVPDNFENDPEITAQLCSRRPYLFQSLPFLLRDNENFVMKVCLQDHSCLEFASERVRSNPKVIEFVMSQSDRTALRFASNSLRSDEKFISGIAKKYAKLDDGFRSPRMLLKVGKVDRYLKFVKGKS